jgi:hypothetical protein
MKKNILFSFVTVLICFTGLNAQKVYELNEVTQIPSIDEDNMKIIAFSIFDLYNSAIKTPEFYSTDAAVENTVYKFYDTYLNGILEKVNPHKGEKYSSGKKPDIEKNDGLLFNLTFNENGALIIPDKIFVISYREIRTDIAIKQVGLIAFELIVPDNIKTKLKSVKLENTAALDTNSFTNRLSPVKVLIPFNLSFGYREPDETSGTIIKRGDLIDITYFNGYEEKPQLIELLKNNSDLMQYKKGTFQFVIEEKHFDYHIDINIGRGAGYSSQPKRFSISSFSVKSFTGEGKKINN